MTLSNSKFENNAENSIGLTFIKVYNQWHRQIKNELNKINITHPQYVVLASLSYLSMNNLEVRQVDISKLSDIDTMTVSDILKLLEKKEFIQRRQSQVDSRAKVVELTKEGHRITDIATEVVENIDLIFFGKLGEEKGTLLSLLKKIL